MADRRTPDAMRLLMGIGLDADGHARLTRGEDFVLVGGSEDTHERMTDDVQRFREVLDKMGTDLQRASKEQMIEAAHESGLIKE